MFRILAAVTIGLSKTRMIDRFGFIDRIARYSARRSHAGSQDIRKSR